LFLTFTIFPPAEPWSISTRATPSGTMPANWIIPAANRSAQRLATAASPSMTTLVGQQFVTI
jgi:hypothetical protein